MVPVRSIYGARNVPLFALAILLLLTRALPAQEVAPPPAHIAVVEGSATVERDGVAEPAMVNALLVPGDRLRTIAGRVEVLFPDGTALDVDRYSAVDLQGPVLIRLLSGRLLLVVAGANDPSSATRYQIDTPAASARTDGPGEYRVGVLNGRTGSETELAVLRGTASLETDQGSMPLGAGERTVARDGGAPSSAQIFNSARYDDFDLWTLSQRDARTVAASAQYLPQDLRTYGSTFDRDGSWEDTQPYGYVWYPTVAPEWRPYYHGYWAPYRRWGWTWIGFDAWAWPTHHYGRWGFFDNRWFWIPGRSWAPAWVSWATAAGYVSWCPLGFDDRAVFASNRRSAWTIVPRHSFGPFQRVDRFAVASQSMPEATAFVEHRRAPVAPGASRGIAIPRVDTGVASRESRVESRQPRIESPRSSVEGPRSTVFGRQPSVAGRAPTVLLREQPNYAVPRQSPVDGGRGLPIVERRPTGDDRRATPSLVTPAFAVPRALPAAPSRPVPAIPRTYAPPPPTVPPASAPPPAPPRTSAPQAVPRSTPAAAPPSRPGGATPAAGAASRSGGEARGAARPR